MTKIQNTGTALSLFEEAATTHAKATEEGDYKVANKNYDIIVKAVAFLKERNEVDKLLHFLSNSSVGVRMIAATYLLPIHEKEAIKILLEISNSSGIHALTAETTLSEWKNGNLRL